MARWRASALAVAARRRVARRSAKYHALATLRINGIARRVARRIGAHQRGRASSYA
jgi:hypothetical protein